MQRFSGKDKYVYSPPKITGAIIGDDAVQLNLTLKFSTFQHVFHLVWTGLSLIFLFLWITAVPLMFVIGLWDEPAPPEFLDVAYSLSPLSWLLLLAIWILPPILEFVFFLRLPRWMSGYAMTSSKEAIFELFRNS